MRAVDGAHGTCGWVGSEVYLDSRNLTLEIRGGRSGTSGDPGWLLLLLRRRVKASGSKREFFRGILIMVSGAFVLFWVLKK